MNYEREMVLFRRKLAFWTDEANRKWNYQMRELYQRLESARIWNETGMMLYIIDTQRPTWDELVTCPDCGGDGKETCHNPDHGFYNMIGGVSCDESRIGCPGCGHNERHKMAKGGPCDTCGGDGKVDRETAYIFCMDYEIDLPEDYEL